MHTLRFLAVLATASLIGCGAADDNAPSPTRSAAAEPSSLFSDTLHDIHMPGPGMALLEFQGQTLEARMHHDCSASQTPPPADQPWEPHTFSASPAFRMAQGEASLDFVRLVHLQEEIWTSAAHEMEVISLTLHQDSEMWTYTLHRPTPAEPAMIAVPMDQPARPARANESLPGIRVHPDGHQATFVGQLGQISMLEELSEPGVEDVRIAIHCGPT